jgi:predicted acyl esterase
MANQITAQRKSRILKGIFYDSPAVQGLEYETQTLSGLTNDKGEFAYRTGETVTFSVGGLVFGSAPASKRLTLADIITSIRGDIKKIIFPKVTNAARFLQSLDADGNVENGITITDETRNIVNKFRYKINFDQPETVFTEDPEVKALFAELNKTLRSPAQARNHVRRTMNGVVKLTDVKIPTRDGSYLLADIFRPINDGKYPTLINLGGYGKAFQSGCICNEKELQEKEAMEDRYFEGNPDLYPWEGIEVASTTDWVPNGYVLVRVDGRGICKTPGVYEQFSLQEAKDFYDAIEWAAQQPWSNGNVGGWGISYWSMDLLNVAQLQPPHLKAMIPAQTDVSSYRDYIYNGGIYNLFNFNAKRSCIEGKYCEVRPEGNAVMGDVVDWISIARSHPFDDPEIYGPEGKICISPDLDKITQPFWTYIGIEHSNIHIRGTSEFYIHAASKNKKLSVVEGSIKWWPYTKEAVSEYKAFFDYWLKGIDNGIMDGPPVKMMVRTGNGGYYWQNENEWPIGRTRYTRYYLDATPANWKGDGKRNDFMQISTSQPAKVMSRTYSAEVNIGVDPRWAHGVSFITEPLPEDVVIAGYSKLVMWVSSASSDMDIIASVRVMDGENDQEIPYALTYDWGRYFPVAIGWLKVSHRKLDPEKSTIYRPYHTHLEADYQPLKPGEIVPVEVELWPTTAHIKKGDRIRVDIQPTDGVDHPSPHFYDETYHKGATNTIYTGPDHPSYLQLPVIPPQP